MMERNSKRNEIKKEEFEKLQWFLYFENPPNDSIPDWFSENEEIKEKYLKEIKEPQCDLSIDKSYCD